jgi:hypothetical protein
MTPNLKELLNPKRGENETYEDYCIRRKASSNVLTDYAQGKIVYSLKDNNFKPYRKETK